MHGAVESNIHAPKGMEDDLSSTQTLSAESSLDNDSLISLEGTKSLRAPVKKEVPTKRVAWNLYLLGAVMIALITPLLFPMLTKADIKGKELLAMMNSVESEPSATVVTPKSNETVVVKEEEPYVIERFYDVPKLDEEALENLKTIKEDMLKAVIECEKAFHKNFDEKKYVANLQAAVDDTIEGVQESLSIPDASYKDIDGEVKAFKDFIWETNIKAGIEAFNEPLIQAAIRSLKQLALFSQKVIPDRAKELVQISHSFKISKSADLGIECPSALYIPDISGAMQKWYAENKNGSEEVRQKMRVLERYYTELTEHLFKASSWLSKISPVYLNSISYFLTPDAEVYELLHTTDYYN